MQAFYYDMVDSTNEEAGRLLRAGRVGPFAYVVARGQNAGKGTRGRRWSSPPDAGIYLTVIDRPAPSHFELHQFTRAAGVACAQVIERLTGIDVRLKPINDLYAGGRKLGGILTEAVIEQGRIRALMTGVGINVRRAERGIPCDHVQPICIEEMMAADAFSSLNPAEITVALVRKIREWNNLVSGNDRHSLEVEWQKRCMTVGGSSTCDASQTDSTQDLCA